MLLATHAKIGAAMLNKRVILNKTALVKEKIETLSCSKLAYFSQYGGATELPFLSHVAHQCVLGHHQELTGPLVRSAALQISAC